MVTSSPWWRQAVIYQVYLRSFADADGDGLGDLDGLRSRLRYLADLHVDGLWLNPCFPSPQADHGYDIADYRDIEPSYGTLAGFDQLLTEAHKLGLRVLLDIVPNHCSVDHEWFRAALKAGPGTPERTRFIFRPGRGSDGEEPPNNWQSVFGGPAWSRVDDGEWYLHLFAPQQPDFNWDNPEVAEEFDAILRFWLDRGVDGLRIDVAHGLVKAPGLPDWPGSPDQNPLMWNQPAVHEIHRRWRSVVDGYGRDIPLIGEVWPPHAADLADYAGAERLSQVFYFDLLVQPWSAPALRAAVVRGLTEAGGSAGGLAWTLANHDVHRTVTRLGQPRDLTPVATPDIAMARLTSVADLEVGGRRARAALLLLLALPGSVFLYQGEELGLPEVLDLPPAARQDPIWHRTGGAELGRDGCRVPLPWTGTGESYGFSPAGAAAPWLPQPSTFAHYAADAQLADPSSMLSLHRQALAKRPYLFGPVLEVSFLDTDRSDVLALRRGDGVCVVNTGPSPYELPEAWGTVDVSTVPMQDRVVEGDGAVWLRRP